MWPRDLPRTVTFNLAVRKWFLRTHALQLFRSKVADQTTVLVEQKQPAGNPEMKPPLQICFFWLLGIPGHKLCSMQPENCMFSPGQEGFLRRPLYRCYLRCSTMQIAVLLSKAAHQSSCFWAIPWTWLQVGPLKWCHPTVLHDPCWGRVVSTGQNVAPSLGMLEKNLLQGSCAAGHGSWDGSWETYLDLPGLDVNQIQESARQEVWMLERAHPLPSISDGMSAFCYLTPVFHLLQS